MAVTGDARLVVALVRLAPPVARTGQGSVQFLFEHRLNEPANPAANAILNGVKPSVEKLRITCNVGRLRGIFAHGVVPSLALQRQNQLGWTTRRLRQPNSNHSRDGTRSHDSP